MKKIAITMLLAGFTLLMADGKAAYAKCAGCHGINGEKVALGKSAKIGGTDVLADLQGYKAGTLNKHTMGGLMKGQVASMDDATMKAVADYIKAMKK